MPIHVYLTLLMAVVACAAMTVAAVIWLGGASVLPVIAVCSVCASLLLHRHFYNDR